MVRSSSIIEVFQFCHKALQVQALHRLFHKLVEDLLDEREVLRDGVHNAGAPDLDGHDGSVEQFRPVHLRNGSGAQGFLVKGGIELADRFAKVLPDLGADSLKVHGHRAKEPAGACRS